jgi:hypothetical protein
MRCGVVEEGIAVTGLGGGDNGGRQAVGVEGLVDADQHLPGGCLVSILRSAIGRGKFSAI